MRIQTIYNYSTVVLAQFAVSLAGGGGGGSKLYRMDISVQERKDERNTFYSMSLEPALILPVDTVHRCFI